MAILALSRLGHGLIGFRKEQLGPPVTYASAGPGRCPDVVDTHDQAEIL